MPQKDRCVGNRSGIVSTNWDSGYNFLCLLLQELINERDVPAYLSHVERRLREENERLLHYLDTSSKWQLVHTVEKQLISEHLTSILTKGLDLLLEENR